MNVFAFWDATPAAPARQAELVALFRRACIAAGNTPRLLTARNAYRSKAFRKEIQKGVVLSVELPAYALHAKRGKYLTDLRQFESCL